VDDEQPAEAQGHERPPHHEEQANEQPELDLQEEGVAYYGACETRE